jgi:DNA-binding transcriptional MerR regulator
MGHPLPPIPAKRYFTIGETGVLCDVKPHVLRYWEQEFTQLRPMKRRGNRRYYQHHEVLMIRKIRSLLYDQGFTISGARNQLHELGPSERWHEILAAEEGLPIADLKAVATEVNPQDDVPSEFPDEAQDSITGASALSISVRSLPSLRRELKEIARLLTLD